ncbi:MAG TPA: HAD family hydrolase [Xanthobacteraceae bacterium]|jgi:putative hydrolase of the HAD superfamily|nr:HAD family hydrolase [Xanthobacteraceae bacterium]
MNSKIDVRYIAFSRLDWVIFDADNTLWDLESLYHDARNKLCRLLAKFGCDPVDVADYQRQRDLELFNVHGRSPIRFPQSFVDTLFHFNAAPHSEDIEAAWNMGMGVFDERAEPYEGVAAALQSLAVYVRIAILTAGNKTLQRKRLADFPYRKFAEVCEIVEIKNVGAFHAFLNDHRINPYHSWMVGDSLLSDIIPARVVGLNTIWVRTDNWSAIENVAISNIQFSERHFTVKSVSEAISLLLEGLRARRKALSS